MMPASKSATTGNHASATPNASFSSDMVNVKILRTNRISELVFQGPEYLCTLHRCSLAVMRLELEEEGLMTRADRFVIEKDHVSTRSYEKYHTWDSCPIVRDSIQTNLTR